MQSNSPKTRSLEMYKHKIIFVLLILLFGVTTEPAYCSEPGRRPDERPWFGSVSDKIVDLYDDLYELKSRRDEEIKDLILEQNKEITKLAKKRRDAKTIGLPFMNDSKSDYDDLIDNTKEKYAKKLSEKRKKYDSKIRTIREKIVDTMASPANDELEEKKEAIGRIQHLAEMYETISVIINTREVVRHLNSELRLNRNDYALACKTYAVELELLTMATHINDIFIERLDSYYKPKLVKRIKENKKAIKANIHEMKNDKSITRDYVKRHNNTLKKMNMNIGKALDDMDDLKKIALRNRKKIIGAHTKTKIIKRVSDSAKEASGYIAQINEDFESIQIDIPDLVEFEYREADLEIAK
jgi:hypothetical protein